MCSVLGQGGANRGMEIWYIRHCLCKPLLFLFCAFVYLQPPCQAFSRSTLCECFGPFSLWGSAFGGGIVLRDIGKKSFIGSSFHTRTCSDFLPCGNFVAPGFVEPTQSGFVRTQANQVPFFRFSDENTFECKGDFAPPIAPFYVS